MTNKLFEAVASAAAHIDMNAADNREPAPQHCRQHTWSKLDAELAPLSPEEQDKVLARHLYGVLRWEGLNGQTAFVQRYPRAARLITDVAPRVSIPKPPGYTAAVTRMVGGWLSEVGAAERTNREDVTALNRSLGSGNFNPDNHMSRPLGGQVRNKISDLFAARGFTLPDAAKTLSQVKQAAKAALAGTLADATAFGSIGTVSGQTLNIGGQVFNIEPHNGHDSIRVTLNGKRVRLRLDALTEFLRQAGLLGEPCSTPIYTNVVRGRTGPKLENEQSEAAQPDTLPESWPQASTPPEQSTVEPAPDPLEMTDSELAALRKLPFGWSAERTT